MSTAIWPPGVPIRRPSRTRAPRPQSSPPERLAPIAQFRRALSPPARQGTHAQNARTQLGEHRTPRARRITTATATSVECERGGGTPVPPPPTASRPRTQSRSAPTSPRGTGARWFRAPTGRHNLVAPFSPGPLGTRTPRRLRGSPGYRAPRCPAVLPDSPRGRSIARQLSDRSLKSQESDASSATATTSSSSSAAGAPDTLSRDTERWESVAYDPGTGDLAALHFVCRGLHVPEEARYHEGLRLESRGPLTADTVASLRSRTQRAFRAGQRPTLLVDGDPGPLMRALAAREPPHVVAPPWHVYDVRAYARGVLKSDAAVADAVDHELAASQVAAVRELGTDLLLERARATGRLFCNVHAHLHGIPRPF